MTDSLAPAKAPPVGGGLAWQVAVATSARLIINTSRRFPYPFAPALSRGLGVPLTAITSLIALNQFTGLLSPLFGPLTDRLGYRAMMMAGVSLLAFGMLLAGFLPFYAVVLLAVFLAGVGKSVFDPALQAYVGERVPFQRRGLIIGLIEFSWAGASLVGVPVAGLLIDRLGWRAPFFVLGGLGVLSLVAMALVIPTERPRSQMAGSVSSFGQAWQTLRQSRAAVGALLFGFFVSVANDNLFVIYGAWLEASFGLGLVALGTATTVIGVAELGGETLTATVADRLGLKRAVIIGLSLSTLSYLALPLIGQTLPLALVALFLIFITFEFTVVTSFSLMTEVLPGARATMMSSFIATNGLGRVLGALLGGGLWMWGGLPAIGLVSGAASALALASFIWGLRNWSE